MSNISRQHTNIVGRAAAILTNSAVASAVLPIPQTLDGWVGVFVDFTIGSLTNLLVNPQATRDGTNWYDVTDPGLLTMTATGQKFFACNCKGAKAFRVQCTGTGTVTNSSATVRFGYQDAGGAAG